MRAFTPILAEVADKEPTLTAIWAIAGVLSIIGFFFARWCRSAAALAILGAAAWAYGMVSEVQDAYVGPAIQRELGRGYVVQAYIAALIPLIVIGGAFWTRFGNTPRLKVG